MSIKEKKGKINRKRYVGLIKRNTLSIHALLNSNFLYLPKNEILRRISKFSLRSSTIWPKIHALHCENWLFEKVFICMLALVRRRALSDCHRVAPLFSSCIAIRLMTTEKQQPHWTQPEGQGKVLVLNSLTRTKVYLFIFIIYPQFGLPVAGPFNS